MRVTVLAATAAVALLAGHAQAADKLTLQLKWVTQAQFGGYFVAKDKGYYETAGLDVDTAEYSIQIDAVAVRRTREGCWRLSFPRRRDGNGVVRSVVRPLSNEVRGALESQVIGALRQRAHIS